MAIAELDFGPGHRRSKPRGFTTDHDTSTARIQSSAPRSSRLNGAQRDPRGLAKSRSAGASELDDPQPGG